LACGRFVFVTDRVDGEFWGRVRRFGFWKLGFEGEKCGFGPVGRRNGQLFHVEQLGKGRNDAGFTVYLAVKNTVARVFFTVEGAFLTVLFS